MFRNVQNSRFGDGPGEPGTGSSPDAGPRFRHQPRARSMSRSAVDHICEFVRSYRQKPSDRCTYGAHIDAHGAPRGEGRDHRQWRGPYPGTPQSGMEGPWPPPPPYAQSYASTVQPAMSRLRVLNVVASVAVGAAMASAVGPVGLLSGVGMFAESEIMSSLMRRLMQDLTRNNPGAGSGTSMPYAMPYPGFDPSMSAAANYGMNDPWGIASSADTFDHGGYDASNFTGHPIYPAGPVGGMPIYAPTDMGRHSASRGAPGPSRSTGPADYAARYHNATFRAHPGGHASHIHDSHAAGARNKYIVPPWQDLFEADLTRDEITARYCELHDAFVAQSKADSNMDHGRKISMFAQLHARYQEALANHSRSKTAEPTASGHVPA